MPGSRQELYTVHQQGHEKYTYFLLAGAGAAIAFAVTQTDKAALSLWQVPLGLAVLAWAISFYFGCLHLRELLGLVRVNYEMLRVESGLHPQFAPDPSVDQEIRKRFEDEIQKSGR